MKRAFLNKIIASTIVTTSLITMAPIAASAAWVKDYQNNWRYTYGNSNAIGWSKINGAWYYFSADGIMQTGVIQINGKIYLLSDSGQMQIGKAIIEGEVYTFSNDGSAIGNKLPSPRRGFDWAGNSVQTFVPNQVMDGGGSPTDPESSAIEDEKDKQEYSLTYKDDDGDKLKTKNIEKNDKVELYKPTKNGYKFVEWNTRKNGEGTSYDYDDEVKMTKDLTLYAQWEDGSESTDSGSTDSDSKDSESNVSVTDITVLSQNDSDKITAVSGTLQMNVKVLPIDASNKKVTWSVENKTGQATISENGLLTAVSNGDVIVKATSKDGSNIIGLYAVTISGQSSGGTTGDDPSTSGETTTSTFEDYTVQSMDATRVNGTSANPKSYKTLSILRTDFDLQNVNAETLAIQGGQKITLNNCKIKNLKINDADGTLELIVGEGCTIDNIDLNKGTTIISKSKLGTMNINTDEVVTIDSSVDTVNVNDVAKIKIESATAIDNMLVGINSQNSIITGDGTIKQFNTNSNVELSVKTIIINKSNIQNLNDRIVEYEALINNVVKIEEATLAVEKAEKSEMQTDIDLAIKAVDALPDSVQNKKDELNARINQINIDKSEIEKLQNAIKAVEEAEQKAKSLSPKLPLQEAKDALDKAKEAVEGKSGLQYGADKINLTERISKVNNIINKIEKLNQLIKAIADDNFTDIDEKIFNSAGILGVTATNFTDIINGLKQLPKVPVIDTALQVQQSVTKIIEDIALREKIESARVLSDNAITDAEVKVNSLFVNATTDSAIKINLGRTEIALAKQKLNQAKDKITNVSSVTSVQTESIKDAIESLNERYNPINVRFIGAVKQLTEKDVKTLFTDDGSRLATGVGKSEIDIVEAYVSELLTLAENASLDTTNIARLGDDINKARQLLIQKEQIAKNLWNTIALSGPSTALSASTIKTEPESGYVLRVSLLPVNSYVINDSSNELKLNGSSVFTYLDENKTTAQVLLNLNGNPTNIRVPVMIKNSGSGISAWSYNTSCQKSQALSNKWEEIVTTTEGYTFKFTMSYRAEGTNNVFTITMIPQ